MPCPYDEADATGVDVDGIDLSREAAVIYTSGTTGRPKGVRLTYGNLWHSAVGSALHFGHHRRDVWLAAMPLFHVGGLSILYRSAIGASPLVLHDRFEVERVLAAIDGGASLVSVVPTRCAGCSIPAATRSGHQPCAACWSAGAPLRSR